MRLVIEGWRNYPHSFTIVNGFQILELVKRPDVELFHLDQEFTFNTGYRKRRKRQPFSHAQSALIEAVPTPPATMIADVTYRIVTRFNFAKSASRRTVVFVNAEWGKLQNRQLMEAGINPRHVASHLDPEILLVTPSFWSKQGLERSGLRPDSIAVVPHGFDPTIFKPVDPSQRDALRRRRGWNDAFVFMHNSLMGVAKGFDRLLTAFAVVAARHPEARLLLKGRDDIVTTQKLVQNTIDRTLSSAGKAVLADRIVYLGETTSFEALAELYQAADAYVAPYRAEAFNLPVLEAAACGLPVLCTRGGPTDDFTTSEFALHIEGRRSTLQSKYGDELTYLEPDIHHLVARMREVIERPSFASCAREKGPAFVRERFTWAHAVSELLRVLA